VLTLRAAAMKLNAPTSRMLGVMRGRTISRKQRHADAPATTAPSSIPAPIASTRF
jgi:hypothetical protein